MGSISFPVSLPHWWGRQTRFFFTHQMMPWQIFDTQKKVHLCLGASYMKMVLTDLKDNFSTPYIIPHIPNTYICLYIHIHIYICIYILNYMYIISFHKLYPSPPSRLGMLQQPPLHRRGGQVGAPSDNDQLPPRHEPQEAVQVEARQVAGAEPTWGWGRGWLREGWGVGGKWKCVGIYIEIYISSTYPYIYRKRERDLCLCLCLCVCVWNYCNICEDIIFKPCPKDLRRAYMDWIKEKSAENNAVDQPNVKLHVVHFSFTVPDRKW